MEVVFQQKGIVPFLKGGLGNQLFILAAAFCASKQLNCQLYIYNNPLKNNKHNLLMNDYNKTIFKYLGILIPVDQSDSILMELLSHGYKFHGPGQPKCFEFVDISGCHPGLYMSHYYQNYNYIKPYETELRNNLLRALQESRYWTTVPNQNRAFIHIRRGDYVPLSHMHFVQPIAYYYNALKILLDKNSAINEILIVSDDPAWVKQQHFFVNLPNSTLIENSNEIETFCAMVSCQGGAICANSSFSWWGAFLGAYAFRSPVVVPHHWFIDPPINLFPEEWHVVG